MADPLYTCCEDGMLSQVPPTDRSGLCPACKATAERVGVSLKRVVDNFVAERARGIGAAPSATAHLSKYEDAASTGNEGVTNWTGCGECDCAFACYHGRTRCIRLPAAGVGVSGDETFRAEYTREELGKGVRGKYRDIDWGEVDDELSDILIMCSGDQRVVLLPKLRELLHRGRPEIDWGEVDMELRTIVYSQTNCHIPEKAWGDLRVLLRKVSGQ